MLPDGPFPCNPLHLDLCVEGNQYIRFSRSLMRLCGNNSTPHEALKPVSCEPIALNIAETTCMQDTLPYKSFWHPLFSASWADRDI
jgi:hypothetical protein